MTTLRYARDLEWSRLAEHQAKPDGTSDRHTSRGARGTLRTLAGDRTRALRLRFADQTSVLPAISTSWSFPTRGLAHPLGLSRDGARVRHRIWPKGRSRGTGHRGAQLQIHPAACHPRYGRDDLSRVTRPTSSTCCLQHAKTSTASRIQPCSSGSVPVSRAESPGPQLRAIYRHGPPVPQARWPTVSGLMFIVTFPNV